MGRPTHYSVELPTRCQALIDRYGAQIGAETDAEDGFNGPLKTTFLLAMATPMVVLPLERIFRPAVWGDRGVADDLALDAGLGGRVAEILGGRRAFGDAPFYRDGGWAYTAMCPAFEVGRDWPAEQLQALASPDAVESARQAAASEVLMVLRNGLAHGGVTYLDRDGRHTLSATHMLGFAAFPSRHDRKHLRLLRVGVEDFQTFLGLWAGWLRESGAADALQAKGPGYYQAAAE
jgi:hypothetical protein